MSEQGLFAEKKDQIKRSLVLSGGGMRLSYQAGVLLAMQEYGLNFSHIDATSGGSLNLSMLLSGLSPYEMCVRWGSLNIHDSLSLLPLHHYLELEQLEGLGDADNMRKKVFPHLGIDCEKIRSHEEVLGTYNVLDYGKKQVKVIPHKQIDEDMIVAGISLPGVFPPIAKNGSVYLDTAFIQDANLMEAVKQGAEEIWLIWGLGNTAQYKGGLLNIYVQMLEMSANGALNNDIGQLREINAHIESGHAAYRQSRPIRLHVIAPKLPLPLDPELYLGKISNDTLIDMGYTDAKRYFSSMKVDGMPLHENITAMQASRPGIRFHEELAGTLQFESAGQIAAAGKQNVRLNLTFHVHDLDEFINGSHSGRITGRISINDMPREIHLSNGQFSLFVETEAEDTRKMLYQADFEWQGARFHLNGEKILRDDPGLDVWQDFSTLSVQLYQLYSSGLKLEAEGRLKVNIANMAKLLASFKATETLSVVESAKVLARFSRFFLGETAEVYF